MEVTYTPRALNDIEFWKKSGNKIIQKKIAALLQSILETPFDGNGKPEALKYQLSGKWSRRINEEHRIIYSLKEKDTIILIHSLKGHY